MINRASSDKRSEYDHLADVFLTGEAANTTVAPQRGSSLVAAMLVNLPVIAGPWIEQLASSLAQDRGPTCLLRERDGQISVDVIAGREGIGALTSALTGQPATLETAVRQCRAVFPQWIIELRGGEAGAAADLSRFDEVFVVTGADEAATVAAFGQIKRLADSGQAPRMTVVVAGSEAKAAEEAAGRISLACRRSLGVEINTGRSICRMRPIPMRHLGRFEAPQDLGGLLADLLGESAGTDRADARARGTGRETLRIAESGPARIALRPRLASDGGGRSGDWGAASSPVSAAGGPATSAPPAAVAGQPRDRRSEAPSSATEGCADAASSATPPRRAAVPRTAEAPDQVDAPLQTGCIPGRLVDSLIELVPELRAMDVECPRARGVEFGFDADGALHALAEDDTAASLQCLIVACEWAREHAALLTRLNPFLSGGQPSDAAALRIVGHLFTSRPRERRHLADGPLHIHVLIRDSADRRLVLAHVGLN